MRVVVFPQTTETYERTKWEKRIKTQLGPEVFKERNKIKYVLVSYLMALES